MKLISWTTGFIIAILILLKYDKTIGQWNKRFLDKQFGLVELEDFGLSYRTRTRQPSLRLNAKGVHLRTSLSVNAASSSITAYVSQVTKPVLNKITEIAMRTVLSDAEFHVKDLTLEKNGQLTHESHIYTDFKFAPSLPVVYSIGPIYFYNKECNASPLT